MGKKVNPIGFRIENGLTWEKKIYVNKKNLKNIYLNFLIEDLIFKTVNKNQGHPILIKDIRDNIVCYIYFPKNKKKKIKKKSLYYKKLKFLWLLKVIKKNKVSIEVLNSPKLEKNNVLNLYNKKMVFRNKKYY